MYENNIQKFNRNLRSDVIILSNYPYVTVTTSKRRFEKSVTVENFKSLAESATANLFDVYYPVGDNSSIGNSKLVNLCSM